MAIAPPVINLVDTVKVDSVESSIDSTISAVDYFPVNVLYTPTNQPYWILTIPLYLNSYERSTLSQRYLTAGWTQVLCPPSTLTGTTISLIL